MGPNCFFCSCCFLLFLFCMFLIVLAVTVTVICFYLKPNTSNAVEKMAAERIERCAAICARRLTFPNVCRTPLVSDELLSVIRAELKRKKSHHHEPPSTGSQIFLFSFVFCRCLNLRLYGFGSMTFSQCVGSSASP